MDANTLASTHAPRRGKPKIQPSPADLAVLKEMNLVQAAAALNRSCGTLRRWKREFLPTLNHPRGRPPREMPDGLVEVLGTDSDANLGRRFNVPSSTVRHYRLQRGLPAFGAQESA